MGAAFGWYRQRYERGQVTRLGIAKLPYPFAHDIGIDAVAQGNTGYRRARLQAFLNNLCFEGFWIRVSLAHGDPLTRAKNGVHLNRWTPSPLTLGSGRCVGRTLTKHQRVTGTIARSKLSRQSADREREPWLLASNLPQSHWNAAQIVAIYKRRMQIEEGFRDVKSEKLGIGLGLHRSRCPKRIVVLLLIAALANYLICLLGLQARQQGHEQRFQSNSLKHKRVLSLWRLGLEYWRNYGQEISRDALEEIELCLRREVHQQAQGLG